MAKILHKKFAETDLEDYLEMSQSEYGLSGFIKTDSDRLKYLHTTNPDHIKWKHLASPFGASSYVRLDVLGKVVGRAPIQPRTLRVASKDFKAGSVMDLLIDSKHRSTPVNFLSLIKACSKVKNFDLVYHTANEITAPLYSNLLRFSNPFSLWAYGFPLRLAGFFSLIFGRRVDLIDWLTAPFRWVLRSIACLAIFVAKLDISQGAMSDDELEALCTKCLRQSGPHPARTNAFLKWRFGDAPLWPATVCRIDRNGQFLGYIVLRKLKIGGLNPLALMDFILDPDTSLFFQLTLKLWLIRKAIISKADALFTMVNPFSTVGCICAGFPLVKIPDRLFPHATPIFVRVCRDDAKELETNHSIHFTLGDLDYF